MDFYSTARTALARQGLELGPAQGGLHALEQAAGHKEPAAAPAPGYPSPVTPPGVTIANYTTDETFTFESQVKPALDARIAALQAAGVTTLGGRAVPAGNDYSFVIDYIPTVKNGAALPPAVLVETYRNGASSNGGAPQPATVSSAPAAQEPAAQKPAAQAPAAQPPAAQTPAAEAPLSSGTWAT